MMPQNKDKLASFLQSESYETKGNLISTLPYVTGWANNTKQTTMASPENVNLQFVLLQIHTSVTCSAVFCVYTLIDTCI